MQEERADKGGYQTQQGQPIQPAREAAGRVLHHADIPGAEEATEPGAIGVNAGVRELALISAISSFALGWPGFTRQIFLPFSSQRLQQLPSSKQFDEQYEWTRCTSISRCAPMLITLCSRLAKLSNNMIQKGLAFGRDWSGSVVNSGAEGAPRSCPAGLMAEVKIVKVHDAAEEVISRVENFLMCRPHSRRRCSSIRTSI
jgi:hypothetical protein